MSEPTTMYIDALEARIRDLEAKNDQYRRVLNADVECLPKCDSYGHEEGCPVVSIVAGYDGALTRIRDLEAHDLRDHKVAHAAAERVIQAGFDYMRQRGEQISPLEEMDARQKHVPRSRAAIREGVPCEGAPKEEP